MKQNFDYINEHILSIQAGVRKAIAKEAARIFSSPDEIKDLAEEFEKRVVINSENRCKLTELITTMANEIIKEMLI